MIESQGGAKDHLVQSFLLIWVESLKQTLGRLRDRMKLETEFSPPPKWQAFVCTDPSFLIVEKIWGHGSMEEVG